MSPTEKRPHATSTTNRRHLIGGTAALAAAIAAGTAIPANAAAAQDEEIHEFTAAWPYSAPPTGHFNTFVASAILKPSNIYGDMIWLPMALYTWKSREWIPMMATNWGFVNADSPALPAEPADPANLVGVGLVEPGATMFQVKLREGVIWSDDTPFTAQDVLTTFSLFRLLGDLVWNYLDRVEAVDDHTVNFVMSQPATVVQRYVIRRSPQPTSVYGEWASKVDELVAAGTAMDSPEARQLLDQFTQFRPETVVASGPFTFDVDSITDAEMTLVRNDKAWNADQVHFNRIRDFNGGLDPISALVVSKEIDYATQPFTPPVEEEILNSGQRIVRPPIYFGPAIILNYGKFPQLLDKRVRQAFACIIDRTQNGTISLGDSGVPVRLMTGLSDNSVGEWLSEEDIASLNTYDVDLEKASALLGEAGWTQEGGKWIMADGTPAKFEMKLPIGLPDFEFSASDAADQLSAFGIETIASGVDSVQQTLDVDSGNFDMSVVFWGNSGNPHPHFSYAAALLTHNTSVASQGGGMQFPLVQETESVGEVDLEKLTFDAADGLDESAQRTHVATLAKAFNELLPVIPLWERYGNNSVLEGVRVAPWPEDGDPIYENSVYADGIVTILMLQGRLKPV